MDLHGLINQFLNECTPGNTNETRKAYQTKLRQLEIYFGDQAEPNITRSQLEEFKLWFTSRPEHRRGNGMVKGKLSPFTIRSTMVTIRYFYTWAHDRGLLKTNPTEGMKIPKEPAAQPKPVDQTVVIRMIEAAAITGPNWEKARNVAILYFFRDTGCRVGGLLDAQLDGLDLESGRALITEKGDTCRYVFLSPVTVHILKVWLYWRSTLNIFCGNIFLNRYGTPLTRTGLYKIFGKIADEAKIETRYNPHSFRHAFARDAIQAGLDLSRLSQLLGHASIDVTNRYYTRFNDSELRKAHNKFTPAANMPEIMPVLEVAK